VSCTGLPDCACGCCSGISVQTPQGETNRPGLSSIAYRTGRWATFKESMLARLSSSEYPALAALKTRDDDDFSIAFLDATAVVLDILTFYQERLANESYLRTATQLYSLTQLSQLIGYQPSPGASASTYLAFTITAATGLPTDPTTTAVTIPAGTQVQSVPAQGQTPQPFQTSANILAKADWNALPVQTGYPWKPHRSDASVYLAGTSTQLQPGDALLIVGDERVQHTASERWDVRLVGSVQTDSVNQRTLVTWSEGLGGGGSGPAQQNPKFFALRQRASLFGYNAMNPMLLAPRTLRVLQNAGLVTTGSLPDWDFDKSGLGKESLVDLDAIYSKLVTGGWLVLIHPDADTSRSPSGFVSLYLLNSVTSITRSDYGISAKISRVMTDTDTYLSEYYGETRSASVFTQSELLSVAEQPLDHPLYGTFLDLEVLRPDLTGATAVAVTGRSQKITVSLADPQAPPLSFVPDDDPASTVTLKQGDTLTLLQPPDLFNSDGSIPHWSTSTTTLTLSVANANGRTGTVSAVLSNFSLTLSTTKDPMVQEAALVSSVTLETKPFPHTRILLKNPLLNCYDRTLTTVNANVGAATAGAPVTELLGSGAAATPNQQFTLKQSPLTYIQAPTPTGSLSTLQVRANGVAWTAVPTLYNQPPTAQVFTTLNLPGGTAQVQFGDGVEGSTLPTGQSNIQASYRTGIGAAGNVAAGAVTTLIDRPLGVSGVINPTPATGGQDPQSIDDIRANAPLSVLTLGRAVSITDYQNFAATFAGIAKAYAIWIPNGADRGVFLTVAGSGGVALPPGNLTLANLVAALQSYGSPNVVIYPQSFLETTFGLSADLCYDPSYSAPAVQASVLQLLQQTYSFASRGFGEGVSGDEVAALIQGVPGIIAVNVKSLNIIATSSAGDIGSGGYSISAYNKWIGQALTAPLPRPSSGAPGSICAYIPRATTGTSLPLPAEILVLDPNPANVSLGVMT
jgi:predicted phage baseplate assembly protein